MAGATEVLETPISDSRRHCLGKSRGGGKGREVGLPTRGGVRVGVTVHGLSVR